MNRFLLLIALVFVAIAPAFSQWEYGFALDQTPVISGIDTLMNPWTGGLTAPQWSPIDFNGDGDEDLFAFDRDGSRLLAFERNGNELTFRPNWVKGWPQLQEWCLLRDYDCDGKQDIFTSYQNGIHVYRNLTEDPEFPEFELVAAPLLASFDLGSGPDMLPVVCISIDVPAILDLDDDGDLDIISFTESSSTLYKYEGLSPCGLEMECTNRCYGMLAEASENNALFIGDDFDCSYNVVDPRSEMRHAGGSITCLQLDDNGPLDLIIGDVTYPTAIAILLDDAYDGQDSATFLDMTFPLETNGVEALDCARFPAGYHIDVDADGVQDLLFSPNTYLETDDDASVHFVKNNGTNNAPEWEIIQADFLQDGMIDLGRGAYPVLTDIDGDGLIDLIVSNKERYEDIGVTPCDVSFYKNTGTLTSPEFTFMEGEHLVLTTYGIESAVLTFGDYDNDGDKDAIVGDEMGRLHTFENTAGEGNWPVFEVTDLSITDNLGETIDIVQFAAPQLIDIDDDGLLDLVVGEKGGNLNLFQNCGTPSIPSWCQYISPTFGEAWGNIYVDNALGINGYSVPTLVKDEVGIRMLVANEIGTIQYFGIMSDDLETEYIELNSSILIESAGIRAGATIADINGDLKFDCLIGIQNGGMLCYLGNDSIDDIFEANQVQSEIQLFPNPGNNELNWLSGSFMESITAFNSRGQILFREEVNFHKGRIDTRNWPTGLYFIQATKTGSQHSGLPVKWVKMTE
jgi:hypothetical protein